MDLSRGVWISHKLSLRQGLKFKWYIWEVIPASTWRMEKWIRKRKKKTIKSVFWARFLRISGPQHLKGILEDSENTSHLSQLMVVIFICQLLFVIGWGFWEALILQTSGWPWLWAEGAPTARWKVFGQRTMMFACSKWPEKHRKEIDRALQCLLIMLCLFKGYIVYTSRTC